MNFKNVERLMMFLEVVEQGSFTKAKDTLGISKGFLSKQIKILEEDLKAKLLVRSTRHMRLTSEGHRAYNHGIDIRKQLRLFQKNIHEENENISGKLGITAPKMFTEVFLVDICHQFKSTHPKMSFEINSSYTNFDLMQNEIDIAIRATTTPPENMVAKKLFSYRHILVASPSYLSTYGEPQSIDEMHLHQCMATPHQQTWPMVKSDIDVNGWMSMNDNHVLKQLAIQGKGIIRVPSYYVQKELINGQLIEILSSDVSTQTNDLYLIYPQMTYVPAKLQAFIESLQNYFKNPALNL
ncbi:LysR family transcriptional regulator [Psychromonas sp. KJ10-10]|uniref:LysR family transcriptional regulator n=1 Tax=Psychromonas sp. KJ10-10 TaxID=3391823 RepID=UPI0039B4961C